MQLRRLSIAAALVLGLGGSAAAPCRAVPPTPDPTYGLPVTLVPGTPPSAGTPGWIWAGTTQGVQTVCLRQSLRVPAVPSSAICYITADDSFTLFVNGKQIDRTRPAPPGLDPWQDVHRLDIAPDLVPGKNVIAIRGFNAGGAAGVVAEVLVAGRSVLQTNDQWKLFPGDAPDGWSTAQFNDAGWRRATLVAPVEGGPWSGGTGLQGWPGYLPGTADMRHLLLPAASVLDVHPGGGGIEAADALTTVQGYVTVTLPPPGSTDAPSLLLDFGREVGGRILLEAQTGGVVLVGTGESREEAVVGPWRGQTRLTLAPGDAAATPLSGFRFVHLEFPPDASDSARVTLRVDADQVYYPVTYRGSFDCSDTRLTKIWYVGAYTAHLCMLDSVVDGVKRDRGNWAGDARVTDETINNVFADRFLIEHSLRDLRTGPQRDRPDTGLPYSHINGIPGYSCAWVCELADFYRHSGDLKFLRTQHDLLISLLEYMRGDLDTRGLFANRNDPKAWLFTDWSPGYDAKDSPETRATTHLFYIKAAREGAFLLREMGDGAAAARYEVWASTMAAAARRSLTSADGLTFGGRIQENAMAVYSGAATPAQAAAIYRTVLRPGSVAWSKAGEPLYNEHIVTPYFLSVVLDALSATGHGADALQVLREYWGGMMAQGATTFWEAYDPHWPESDFHRHLQADYGSGYGISLCHGWSSGATDWLTERLLGVRPTSGGFRTVQVVPDLCGLAWAEGDVPTPRGLIHVRAARTASGVTVALRLPAGTDAIVGVPGAGIVVNGTRRRPTHLGDGRAYVHIASAGSDRVSSLP